MLSQSLVANYLFNGNGDDISNFKNNGELVGGVAPTIDRFGNPCSALSFNGTDGYIIVPNSPSLQNVSSQLSITCWVLINHLTPAGNESFDWLTILCKGNLTGETSSCPQYRLQAMQSQKLNLSTISISTKFTEYDDLFKSHNFDYDVWMHYSMVYDGKTVCIYLNGARIWQFNYSENFETNNLPLYIGRDIPGADEFFCGALDDLKIYNGALSNKQVVDDYNQGNSSFNTNTLSITCPNSQTIYLTDQACTSTVYFDEPSVDSKCGGVKLELISGLKSGSNFPLGPTVIGYNVESEVGIIESCNFNINLVDTISPEIVCPQDTTIILNEFNFPRNVDYSDPIAIDNCKIKSLNLIKGFKSGGLVYGETTEVIYQAEDESGNKSNCSFYVNLEINQQSKTNNCPPDMILPNDRTKCGADISELIPKNFEVVNSSSGGFCDVGNTAVKLSLKSGSLNSAECQFAVTVLDKEKPSINCPNDTIIYTTSNETIFNFSSPECNDNCIIDPPVLISGITSGGLYPIGMTQNVFKVSDKSGNTSICSFNVIFIKQESRYDDKNEVPYHILNDQVLYSDSLSIDSCVASIVIYDDKKEDFDTVSIFFNGVEIVKKQMIKSKKNGAIIQVLNLNKFERNTVVSKAWNTGEISPNTLRMDFYSGDVIKNPEILISSKPTAIKTVDSEPGKAGGLIIKCK